MESYQRLKKQCHIASPLGSQNERDIEDNKPASSLVFLGNELNRIPPSLRGRQMMGPSNLFVVVAYQTMNLQTEHELIRVNGSATYRFV